MPGRKRLPKMKAKIALTLAIVGLLIVAAIHFHSSRLADESQAIASAASKDRARNATFDQDNGIMSRRDAAKLSRISTSIQQSRTVSDQDLAWILALLKGPPLKDTPGNRANLQSVVLLNLWYLTKLTPRQQGEVTQAALPLLSSSQSTARMHGLFLIRISRNRQALPLVEPLLSDRNKEVSQFAAKLYSALKGTPTGA